MHAYVFNQTCESDLPSKASKCDKKINNFIFGGKDGTRSAFLFPEGQETKVKIQ